MIDGQDNEILQPSNVLYGLQSRILPSLISATKISDNPIHTFSFGENVTLSLKECHNSLCITEWAQFKYCQKM